MALAKMKNGLFLALVFAINTVASAQTVTPTSVKIDDDKLSATIVVSSTVKLDLLVEFEKSVGLSADNIDISATLLDVTDPVVTSRLTSTQVNMLSEFPVMLSISPKASSGFAFEGLASVEIYTKAVDYNASMPARLYRSHDGGNFEDITSMVSPGSIRARGNTGSFSDFVILLDQRSSADMLSDTFNQLDQLVSDNTDSLSVAMSVSLQTSLSNLNNALLLAEFDNAAVIVDSLIEQVEDASAAQMTNVWRSTNDLTNMQGELLTRLMTLRYTLRVM